MRITLDGKLGSTQLAVQVDVGFGDSAVPPPTTIEFPTLLPFPVPVIRAYAKETVVAEKLHAMVDLGMANTRMKDFFDLWFLCRELEFDGSQLVAAIRSTFERRQTPLPAGLPLALTDTFALGSGTTTLLRANCAGRARVARVLLKAGGGAQLWGESESGMPAAVDPGRLMMSRKPFVIVVGCDFSEQANRALKAGFEQASLHTPSELHVRHATLLASETGDLAAGVPPVLGLRDALVASLDELQAKAAQAPRRAAVSTAELPSDWRSRFGARAVGVSGLCRHPAGGGAGGEPHRGWLARPARSGSLAARLSRRSCRAPGGLPDLGRAPTASRAPGSGDRASLPGVRADATGIIGS